MGEVLENGDLLADVFNDDVVDVLSLSTCLLVLRGEVLLKLFGAHVEVRQGELLHRILVLTALDEVDGTIGAFADQIHDFEAADELVFSVTSQLLEVSHGLKVKSDLPETLLISLLVELFQ